MQKLSKVSPANYRPDVADAVLIFTDGQPIRRKGEDTFGDKYSDRRRGECLLAKDRAKDLRDREVTVVGLGIGTQSTLDRFKDDMKNWSTDGKYFVADKEHLESVMSELISASCIDPGKGAVIIYGCRGTAGPFLYLVSGGRATVKRDFSRRYRETAEIQKYLRLPHTKQFLIFKPSGFTSCVFSMLFGRLNFLTKGAFIGEGGGGTVQWRAKMGDGVCQYIWQQKALGQRRD